MSQPQIIIEDWQGRHNANDRAGAIAREGLYNDCSTISILPTRGVISARVYQNHKGMITPMNQKYTQMVIEGMEVGAAYESAINQIINSELSTWKFILCIEEDNLVPPDGLLKLLTAMHEHPEYSAIGGLYWTKGEGGAPMCYGDPKAVPLSFAPIMPAPNAVTECNGLGQGFTLFRMDLFKDPKIERPWFKTCQGFDQQAGAIKMMTQDLYFFEKARKAGHRVACDSRVLVGHYDHAGRMVW